MSDFAAYTFYVNRLDLLRRSVESFPALRSELTVVDNSDSDDLFDPGFEVSSFYKPPVPFTYAQSMNWMLRDSQHQEVDFILHFHSDAYSTNPAAVYELLAAVRSYKATNRRWACAWTHYDLLWAINPAALTDIGGWDTSFPTYFGDNDFRRRSTLAGWECIDTHIQGINHEGSATIKSDPKLNFLNGQTFPLYQQLYRQKWGGGPGNETFLKPFDGALEG